MNHKKILIIDDEPDIVEFISDFIEIKMPHLKVFKATSFEEAKSKIEEVDIVISDINMPQREELDQLLLSCKKPVGRITGYVDIQDEWVIHKPFQYNEMEKLIENLLLKKV